jgi:hypothetical protein
VTQTSGSLFSSPSQRHCHRSRHDNSRVLYTAVEAISRQCQGTKRVRPRQIWAVMAWPCGTKYDPNGSEIRGFVLLELLYCRESRVVWFCIALRISFWRVLRYKDICYISGCAREAV